MTYHQPNDNGFYGRFGGRFVPETLMTAVLELDQAYRECKADPSFQAEFKQLLKTYVGRETPPEKKGLLWHGRLSLPVRH